MNTSADAKAVLRSTDEKENFHRLTRLLMCGGVRLLREKFDSFHSPTDLQARLGDPTIFRKLKKAKLSQPEWDILYPSTGTVVKSTDFDITLTFRLLRTICNLTKPLTGWNTLPNSTDLSLEAELVRIKYYRNHVYGHNQTMEINDSEFDNLWKEISEALLRIAESISKEKRREWEKAINEFRDSRLITEEQRYVDELKLWYKKDMEVKDAVEQLGDQLQQLNQKLDILICVAVERFSQGRQPIASSHLPIAPTSPEAAASASTSTVIVPIHEEQPQFGGVGGTSREHLEGDYQDPLTGSYIWRVILSPAYIGIQSLLEYLRVQLGVNVVSHREGSLLITVTCSSLQILEGLWEDYSSGNLNKVVEQTLVTPDVLEKLGLSELKLKTTITEEGYYKCKEFFLTRDKKPNMALSKEQTEDEISQLCSGILEYKIGTYEEFQDALDGEMEGSRLNVAVFGMPGSGKSALINTIFRSLGIESEPPAIIQDAGKEGTKMLETYVVPGTDITLFDTCAFFEMDGMEEGELFRILFGIEKPGEYLTRGSKGVEKAKSAGVAAHRLKKPPIVDQMHVILWVIKAVDIRFQLGQYREKIKFVQDQLRKATITIITVITFDDAIQGKENADEEREKLKKKVLEVTGSHKKNVFMIANSVEGQEYDSIYRERVLKILELAAKSGERSIRMRQATRENLRRPTRASESVAGVKRPVENTEEPDYPGKKWWSMP